MSKDRNKLVHIHSSQLNRQPKPETLVPGELAVNNFSGGSAFDGAFISTKNSADKVVRFSEDRIIANWIENKEVFPYSGNVDTITTQNRLDNESELVIHLNQAPAVLSPEHSAVIQTDGVYFKVDMHDYAMIGANPSFSSVTTTCGTRLNGSTYIIGLDDSCGSLFDVDVNTINFDAGDINVSGDTIDVVSDAIEVNSSDSIVANTNALSVSGNSATIKENTVDVSACTRIGAVTNNFTVSGCDENAVAKINTCGGVEIKTDDLKFITCTDTGKTTVQSCGGYKINSNDAQIIECDPNGQFLVKETNSTISGTNLNVIESLTDVSGTSLNVKEATVDASACTHISAVTDNFVVKECNTGGTFDVSSSAMTMSGSNYTVKASKSICEATSGSANFAGSASTVIGIDCSSAFTSTTTQVVGKQIHVSATTSAITMSGKTAISGMAPEIRFSASTVDVDADMTLIDGLGLEVIETNHIATKAPSTVQIGSALTIYDNTIDVSACTRIYNTTDDFKVVGCTSDATASIEACDGITLKTDDFVVSGCDGGSTHIKSCNNITLETDELVFKGCDGGNITIDMCSGYEVKSDDIYLHECDPGGTFRVASTDSTISGSTLTVKENTTEISGTSLTVKEDTTDINGVSLTVKENTASISGSQLDVLEATTNVSGNTLSVNENATKVNGNVLKVEEREATVSGDTLEVIEDSVMVSACTSITNVTDNFIITSCTQYGETTIQSCNGVNIGSNRIRFRECENSSGIFGVQVSDAEFYNDVFVVQANTICESANTANFAGTNETNIGMLCGESAQGGVSQHTNIKGDDLRETANTIRMAAETGIAEHAPQINVSATTFEINADDAHVSGDSLTIVEDTKISASTQTADLSACTHIYNTTNDFRVSGCDGNASARIDACNGISLTTNDFVVQGCDEGEGHTYIQSCDGITLKTDDLTFETCTSAGTVNVNACGGFRVDSDDIKFFQCTNGDFRVRSDNSSISSVDLMLEGSTRVFESGNTIDIYASNVATLSGANNVNAYGDAVKVSGSSSAHVYGDEILVSGDTVAVRAADNVSIVGNSICASSSTDTYVFGSSSTNVGVSCEGNALSSNVNIKASATIAETTPAYTLSGTSATVKESQVDVSACTHIYNTTDDFKVIGCTNAATTTIETKTNISGETRIDNNAIISGNTNISGNTTIGGDATISGKTKAYDTVYAYSGLSTNLNWEYVTASDFVSGGGDVGDTGSTTFKHGDGNVKFEIPIVTSMKDLEEYQECTGGGHYFELDTDICMTGNTINASAFYSSSDRNLKENIRPVSNDDINKIKNVELKSFQFKSDEHGTKKYGVIAQDVKNVGLDELVAKDSDGNLSVDYTSLLILKIAQLEEMVGKLTKEIEDIKSGK